MKLKISVVIVCSLLSISTMHAQVILNEGSNRNLSQIMDEDGENEDWIEIYNTTDSAVNLAGWSLSDNKNIPDKWIFPNLRLPAKQTLLIFASAKDRKDYVITGNWESPVLPTHSFKYLVPTSTVNNWNTIGFDAGAWKSGEAGFGYGDNDDATELAEGTLVVYIRKTFTMDNLSAFSKAVCHMDYDDGFVAYLNGVEICRGNISGTPTWNSSADGNREAIIKNGETPDAFELDMDLIQSVWQQGENVFAVEGHNVNNTSSDMSLIPYLSFNVIDGNTYYESAPDWFSNADNKYLHTNFKIAPEGETITLYNAKKELVSTLRVDDLALNHSVGRATDGGHEFAIFTEATPGSSNENSMAYVQGYAQAPAFSLEAGFYSGSQNLIMYAANQNYEIRYTTDGSTPTESATLYNDTALVIDATQTIRARCFSTDNIIPSKVTTATYLIDEDISVPVLSVTTDASNLFGSTGIFTNYSQEWNKPCHIEYFGEDQSLDISQASGIQVDGGAGGSRSKPQTSFRIEPGNGTFGDGDVKYQFHPERTNRESYASLYLRNGSNQYLTLIYKDAAQVRSMGKRTYNCYSEYRPIVVFINGEYYGVYEGREKINADYLQNNYGIDPDSMDMVGISHFKSPRTILPIVGSTDPFFEDYDRFLEMNPSSPKYLEEVSKFLDLDNYTDYMAGQTWMTNKDWPHNNMKAWRCKGTDMRWQFAIVDLEWSFLPTRTSVNLATLPSFDQISYMNALTTQWPASGYWYKLMQNNDYKHRFINRLCDLMNTNYSYGVIGGYESEIYKEINPEMKRYYERWIGSDVAAELYEFSNNHNDFRHNLSTRSNYLREHIQTHYNLDNQVSIELNTFPAGSGRIKISTITPENYPWSGVYFTDVPITVEAIAMPGYTFKGWDANEHISDVTSKTFTSEINALTNTFTANFERTERSFKGVTISEINYKKGDGVDASDWFEIWNASDDYLSLKGWYFKDNDTTHVFVFAPDQGIEAGERLVVAENVNQFWTQYPQVENITGGYEFGLGKPSDEIRLYNANDELVVHAKYSDLYPWPLSGDISGKTLELINPEASLLDMNNWFAGCYQGSPGRAYSPNCGNQEPSSIEETIAGGAAVKAYPNPVQNNLTLEMYTEAGSGNAQIRIYNTMGALVYKKDFKGMAQGLNRLEIDVANLPEDQMYFVSVTGNNFNQTIKLIKE